MNRLGWGVLIVLLTLVGGFIALQTPGQAPASRPAAPVKPAPAAEVSPSGLVVPVAGVRADQLSDSWHDPREGGARVHEALDIMAPGGAPVVAAMAGTVEKLFQSARGGTTAYVRSDDGKWIAYYAHLAAYAPGLAEGQHVPRGGAIGFVGDTGDAGQGNFHLHFALQRMAAGERWWQGTPVNPYPILAAKPSSR